MRVEAHRNSLPIQAKNLNIMNETDKAPCGLCDPRGALLLNTNGAGNKLLLQKETSYDIHQVPSAAWPSAPISSEISFP